MADAEGPSQIPAGLTVPGQDIQNIINKTAQWVAKNGPAFEQKIMQNNASNAKFGFLIPTNPFYAYYQFKVKESTGRMRSAEDETKRAATIEGKATEIKRPTQDEVPVDKLTRPEEPMFTIRRPPGVSALEISVIKLAAQFMARNGPDFVAGLLTRERTNPLFDFIKPTHFLHTYFRKLVNVYQLCITPPSNVMVRLDEIVNNNDATLRRINNRVQWEKNEERKAKLERDAHDQERLQFSLIDWHEFVVVETIDFDENETNLPAPDKSLVGGAAASSSEEVPPPPPPPEEEQQDEEENDMDVEMEMDDDTRIEDDDDEQENIKIVKNYEKPKPAAEQQPEFISPLTGQRVLGTDVGEHVRLGLLDPKWKQQREAMQAKHTGTALAREEEIASNLQSFAQKRKDLLGGDKYKEIQEEEEAKRKAAANKIIWDGHTDTIESTTKEAFSQIVAQEQHRIPAPPPPPLASNQVAAQTAAQTAAGLMPPPPPGPPPPAIAPAAPQHQHQQASTPQPHTTGPMVPPPGVANMPNLPAGISPLALAVVQQQQLMMGAAVVPPPPPQFAGQDEPAAKRPRTDQGPLGLVPEEEFATNNPAEITVQVRVPVEPMRTEFKLSGQIIAVALGVRDQISVLKDKIKSETNLPPGKQNLNVEGLGFLKNDKTVAFYNLTAGRPIVLTVKERGGRKR